MRLFKNQQAFSEYISVFWKSRQILNTLKKEITLIADVFPKLRIPRNVVR